MSTEELILEFCTAQFGRKDLTLVGLKLCEEAGEVAGALVKRGEGRATEEQLDQELGDVLIVLSQIAARRGTTLEELRARRFEQIKVRAWKEAPIREHPNIAEIEARFGAFDQTNAGGHEG